MNKASQIAAVLGILALFTVTDSIAQTQTYCTNIAGNIACTSYDQGSSSQSYCTSISNNLTCTTYGDDYNRIQVLRNYEDGQVIGTALGTAVMDAIGEYQTHRRIQKAKRDEWNQFVQDTLAKEEVDCEADPAKQGTTVVGCRTMTFTFNQFLHRHQSDFVPEGTNVNMLADALDKTAPPDQDQSTWTEQTYEIAFRTLDKKKLDKKVYLGLGSNRTAW